MPQCAVSPRACTASGSEGAAIATKLDRMLQPGERVTCRAVTQWRDYIFPCLTQVAGVAGAGVVLLLLFRPEGWRFRWLIVFVVAMTPRNLLIVPALWRATAVITDRRVLYAHGIVRPRIIETPVRDIAGLDLSGGVLTLVDRVGETVELFPAPEAEKPAAAITRATSAGV